LDFFKINTKKTLSLSDYALDNLAAAEDYLESEEISSSFWIPSNFERSSQLDWFDWIGHPTYTAQKTLRVDIFNNQEYIHNNYVAGLQDEEITDIKNDVRINLKSLNPEDLGKDREFMYSGNMSAVVESFLVGAQKRHAKTILHDRMVKKLAEKFIAQNATVESDPDSIDLFARWPDGKSAIFEIKTVTRRSFPIRLRMAIGQISEYAYRNQMAQITNSDLVIAVNSELTNSDWQTRFLNDYLEIGLICMPPSKYAAWAPKNAQSQIMWLT
jgi:hypothetical protein